MARAAGVGNSSLIIMIHDIVVGNCQFPVRPGRTDEQLQWTKRETYTPPRPVSIMVLWFCGFRCRSTFELRHSRYSAFSVSVSDLQPSNLAREHRFPGVPCGPSAFGRPKLFNGRPSAFTIAAARRRRLSECGPGNPEIPQNEMISGFDAGTMHGSW